MDDDEFKYFPMPPEGLVLLKQYQTAISQLRDDIGALHTEYHEKIEALHVSTKAELRDLWFRMAPTAEVDALASWDNEEWSIEARYLETGFGALTFMPRPTNPLAAMFGAPPKEDEPPVPGEGPPPGTTLN